MSLVEAPIRNLSLRYRKEIKARLWNAPVKPTGRVYSEAEKRALESAVIGDDQYAAMAEIWLSSPRVFFQRPDRPKHRDVTAAQILTAVGGYFLITPEELLSPQQDRRISRPRQIAMYLNKKLTLRSNAEIGRRMGRDHTTVLHGVRKITAMLDAGDQDLADEIAGILRRLGNPPVPACVSDETQRGEG